MVDTTELNLEFYNTDYSEKVPGLNMGLAKKIGDKIGVDWDLVDLAEWTQGIKEELEHMGVLGGEKTAVIPKGDLVTSSRIAYEHLLEVPDYYSRLEQLEKDGEAQYPDKEAIKTWVKENRKKYQGKWEEACAAAEDAVIPKA